VRLHIRGGRVIDPANQLDDVLDVLVSDGEIVAVGSQFEGSQFEGFQADQVIAAENCIVCPGFIDLRARLREPGFEHKATIASETAAAARSGITTLCCPPDTDPVIDTPAVVELINHRVALHNKARVVTIGALTLGLKSQQISEMQALKRAGCVGVGNALVPVMNTLLMRRAMEYAASHDLTVFLQAEDPWLASDGCVHEGRMSVRLGLPGIPEIAETVAVARELALIAYTGVRAHFCQLSSLHAVRLVARAQHDGLPVSADVAMHYLHLTEVDIADFNVQCHVRPPLRLQRDRAGLRVGVTEKIITAICSDHQPHEPDAKLGPFSGTEAGISGLRTLLPLGLRLVDEGVLSLSELIRHLTCAPAGILGLTQGTLKPGADADICVFDPERYWTLDETNIESRGKNSPFIGWEFKGWVTATILGGELVYSEVT